MAIEVTMPKFGLTMHEGTIQRFFKALGDPVAAGEPLYEVETEKVLYEVEAPASGILAVTLAEEGATVECGAAVAVIAEPGEDLAALAARYEKSARPSPAVAPAPPAASGAAGAAAPSTSGGRRAVSPVARKLAADLGVDLDRVAGTGPGGRITREDVERAAKSPPPAPAPSPPAGQRIALRGVRKTIAERMHRSLQQTAQITITTETDVTALVAERARLSREFDLTYNDLVVYAVARALMRHPRMNSRLDGAEIFVAPHAHVGIAVSLDDGLIVPVIANADLMPLREIAAAGKALGEKARAGQLKLEDVSGGTFTVTNLGRWAIDAFTPILNSGETGILGVGRIVERPAVHAGAIVPRSMLTLSLTFDHRVIDGAPAAEFLQTVVELLNSSPR